MEMEIMFAVAACYSIFVTFLFVQTLCRRPKFDGKLIKYKYEDGDVDYILRVYEVDKLEQKKTLLIKVDIE